MPSTVLLILLCVTHAGPDGAPAVEQQSNEGSHAPAEAIQNAQRASQAAPLTENSALLAVSITDENGVVVPAAQILLSYRDIVFRGETDLAGRFDFRLRPGLYEIRVEKEGFYVFHRADIVVAQSEQLAVTLNHFQEFSDQTEVVYSPPAVDPAKTAGSETLTTREIVNLPYTTSRDFRNLLPMIPGVVRDPSGQIHVNGSAAHQIFNQLDGFNITHPVSGALEMRLSVDALRQIEVQGTRHSAEYGKGSGGAVGLTTGMGDDHFSFSATNFLPGVKAHGGLRIDDWTPRATFSGPLRKGKAWFFNAADGETHLNILKELPAGKDENRTWRFNNLAKVQVNLSPSNIFTASVLANKFRSSHAGLSRFSPVETTRMVDRSAYLLTLKDQILFSRGLVVNLGFAVNTFNDNLSPLGRLSYVIRPNGNSGNFFKRERSDVRRVQWIADVIFQPLQWRGRHEFKVGMDAARVKFRQDLDRTPILVYRKDGTLSRGIEFFGAESLRRNISEVSGWLQERWWPAGWLLVELGLRSDWDQVMRQAGLSPRLAATGTLPGGKTKFSSGVGIFRDATNLSFITRPSEGRRVDSFYSAETQTRPLSMVETRFEVNEKLLRSPRFVNWSIGLERMLPGSVYSHLEFIQKRGSQGLTFVNADSSSDAKAFYALRNIQRDRFDSIQLTVKKNVEKYGVMSSYTRSWARSNAVIDFSLDEPVFARQSGGDLPWDVPHRLLSWGWLPLVRKYDFAYLLEWRSGFPYSFVNEEQRLVGSVNTQRLPSFFSLNLHVERRFTLSGYQWALRAGSNNVTNHKNPSVINNNIDSAEFLKFGGVQDRVFTARIRFLGRK